MSHTNAGQQSRTLSTASQLPLLICVMGEAFSRPCTAEILLYSCSRLYSWNCPNKGTSDPKEHIFAASCTFLGVTVMPANVVRSKRVVCSKEVFQKAAFLFGLNLTGLLLRHPPYMLWKPPHALCTLVKPEFLRPLCLLWPNIPSAQRSLLFLPSAQPTDLF